MTIHPLPDGLEIKPRSTENALKLVAISFLFVIVGIFLIYTGKPIFIILGLLCVLFYGRLGTLAIPKAFQRDATMVLSGKGIELQRGYFGKSFLSWMNVEEIGICTQYRLDQTVGIKLKNYDEYLADINDEKAAQLTRKLTIQKVVYFMISYTPGSPHRKAFRSFRKVANLKDILHWTRENFGYDILIGESQIDRTANDFLELLQKYLQAYGNVIFVKSEDGL